MPSFASLRDRIIGGARRRILSTRIVHPYATLLRDAACLRHRRTLGPPPLPLQPALRALETDGVFAAAPHIAPSLGCDLPDVASLFDELERDDSASTARRKASDLSDAALYVAGLHPTLLDIAEHHIGLPPLYLGVEAKVEFPTGVATGVRNWHRDLEDVRVLKVLIYLSDVGPEDGPLECLTRDASEDLRHRRVRLGIASEIDIGLGARRLFTGPAGTAILFDGAMLVHRVKPPTRNVRRSLIYSYTSNRPRQIFSGARPSRAIHAQLPALLSERQMRAIP